MSAEKAATPLPLFEEKEKKEGPPSDQSVLRHLAQILSVTKTLKHFPSLSARQLQEILLRSAQRAEEKKALAGVVPPPKRLP